MVERPGFRELVGRVRRDGIADARRRLVKRLYDRFDVDSIDFPLLPEDIADSTRLKGFADLAVAPTEAALTIGWVCTPPSAGSGGHTTLFRMVAGMEQRGHHCILYLYDRHGGDIARHTEVIRRHWPFLRAEIRDAADGIAGADAYVASSWGSAHVLASRAHGPGARYYFIQDYEPFFYPRGALQALAEDSYRFGFTNIALGEMVATELRRRDIDCAVAPFGCDTDIYSLTNRGVRNGVVFYTKRGIDRRAFLLGKLALEEFHLRHPEQDIHLYGGDAGDWRVPAIRHDRMTPADLNELYNCSVAGLAMSFTNISLVAEEMLAAGTIPIINDSSYSRADLGNPFAEWAVPTVGGIADALSRVIEDPAIQTRRDRAAASVRQGWGPAQSIVATMLEQARPVEHRADSV